ncbi:MAG TPA: FkbM family methyltransferase [Hanamia sp.]|nr:FkbM family methyltransferase [Hanamia sp.]
MLNYFKRSLKRKIARRVTKEYQPIVATYDLEEMGKIEFANWSNPLVMQITPKAEMVHFFKQFINQGDLVIDIGANIGDTTVPMAFAAGSVGLTLAFDPNPLAFKILEKNASLNTKLTNIKPIPFAISKEDQEYFFISSEASFGNGAISSSRESIHGKFIHDKKVKGVNLEKFLSENYNDWLPKLSFIKVDAEGYDKEIIKSISGLIQSYKPVIVAECFDVLSKDEKIELFDILSGFNYRISYFQDFDINSEVIKLVEPANMLRKETFNLYAVPENYRKSC